MKESIVSNDGATEEREMDRPDLARVAPGGAAQFDFHSFKHNI